MTIPPLRGQDHNISKYFATDLMPVTILQCYSYCWWTAKWKLWSGGK